MPEGPEVEVVRLGLKSVLGKSITSLKIANQKKYKPLRKDLLKLKGTTIKNIERRGKFLLWYFEGKEGVLGALNHLGMTGVFHHYSDETWQAFEDPFTEFKHYKVYFHLSDNSHLLFVDVRTFGRFQVYSITEMENHPSIKNLGPDILDQYFDTKEFILRAHGKKIQKKKEIGKILLDYNVVAGCGNIYKSEALHRAKIDPFTPVNELDNTQLSELAFQLTQVGKEALANKGSTIRDYRHTNGYSGLMQNKFRVYGRADEPCVTCGSSITSAKQGDRTTFWCGTCQ